MWDTLAIALSSSEAYSPATNIQEKIQLRVFSAREPPLTQPPTFTWYLSW